MSYTICNWLRKRPLLKVVFALTLLFVLSGMSCAGKKQVVQEYNRKEQTDVETTLIKTTKPITVPQSSVELILSLENLRDLPPGASYHDKSGQANLNVVSDGGNLIITSSCDSLQLVIEQWEFRYNKLLREHEELQKTEVKERDPPLHKPILWFCIGLISGLVVGITLYIYYIRKKRSK